MGKDRKQKQEIKFLKGLIDSVDISVRKKWYRHNFDIGYFRMLRNKIKEKGY